MGHGKAPLPHHHPPLPFQQHAHMLCAQLRRGLGNGKGGGLSWEVKGGGCMQVYDNTSTDAVVEKSLNCKQGSLPGIQESKYQLMRGSGWKKGRCEKRFMLSCFCICASWMDLSSSHYSFTALAALSSWRYGLNHPQRLKWASVTVGVTTGKNLSDSVGSHLSRYLFHSP